MSNATTGGAAINSVAVVQSGQVMLPTLLGQSAQRIPVGGRIRAGIKALTRRAAENQRAREIYERGVAAGVGFETIEREIAQAVPDLKNPLTPKNVPYFTVRGEDFPNPHIARQILEAFGEDRGDGVKRLYRFPVVFPADAWQQVMPHELIAWTASERRYWSEYSADGQVRYCKTHAPVPVDKSGRRTIRIWGGRKTVLREENGGLCDPESCPQYQDKKCNLSGRFIFFIPGIKSISAFELATNSFYAMNAAIQKFQTIGFMRGGRISGFLDGQRTPFYITKRLVEVPRIDEEGRAVRVAQWLIDLEAPIDVTALLRPDDGLDALEMRANEAVNVLEGAGEGSGSVGPTTMGDGRVMDVPAARGKVEVVERVAPAGDARPAEQVAQHRTQAPARPAHDEPRQEVTSTGADETARVLVAAAALGVDSQRYEAYADKRWGKGWKMNVNGRKRALDELTGFKDDAEGFKAKVTAELDVFS